MAIKRVSTSDNDKSIYQDDIIDDIVDEFKVPRATIPKSLTLTEYLLKITDVVKEYIPRSQWVVCEIVSFKESKGNYYFEIVDTNGNNQRIKSQSALLFKNKVFNFFSKFKEATGSNLNFGMKVLFKLSVEFTPTFGFSLYIEDINPSFTVGEMEAKANNIRAKMKSLGVESMNKSLSIPNHFTSVAVISPSGAAGLGDFKVEADLLENHGLCKFNYFTATFEGKATQDTVVKAFKEIHLSDFKNYDCLVFIRGGGAKSSLQFLNEELIIRCICRTPIPVITGIGHEMDKVLADEYSCLSLDTPSKVIEYITNSVVRNYMDASNTVNEIYNITEQVIDNYNQQAKLISQSSYNLLDSALTNYENICNKNVVFINASLDSSIVSYENMSKQNLAIINTSLDSSFIYYENTFRESSDYINTRVFDVITQAENLLDREVQLINNQVDLNVTWFENMLDRDTDYITSELLKNVELKEYEFKSVISEIRELDPTKILKRGYSIIKVDNKIVNTICELNLSNSISIVMSDGEETFNISK